jgi:hypothetical protein
LDKTRNTEKPDDKIQAQQILGNLVREFLGTAKPTGSKASQKWLDQDEAQQAVLSRFWAQMRNRHYQTFERLNIGNNDIEADLPILFVDLAPEHISNVEKERAAILAKIAEKESEKTTKKPPSKSEIQTQ